MECKKCGKEISVTFEYCDECRELLKEEEFNRLIEENKKLNKLEITKELETLDNIEEVNENDEYLKEELKDLINFEEEEKEEKKTVIIIVSIICSVILALGIVLTLILIKPKGKEEVVEIDYEKIINSYGDSINLIVSNYLKENSEIPSWSFINELINYKDHEVICNTKKIYKDGNIYLDECKVDGIKTKYSYGKEQKEKEGKIINVYRNEDNCFTDLENENLVGTITCGTEECEFIVAYEKFVLIKENDKYYLYNYENGGIEFGPFEMNNTYEKKLLAYENKLYGIVYENGTNKSIYNVNTENTLKDIDGNLLEVVLTLNPTIMYKYGYVIFENENNNNFVNLNTGNISYTIEGKINNFIESYNKDLVYITTYNSINNKITIYNSNGKKLFNGNEYNDILIQNKNIIIYNDTNYYIYDYNLKKILSSKTYDKVLAVYDTFVVVINNKKLELLDLNDNVLATYDLEWQDNYTFNEMLSGTKENIINLVIETSNKIFNYYYNLNTKEYGLK